MTFGIIIPTYSKHVCHLEELLDSIEANTVLPDVVSISCSGINTPLVLKEYSFKLILTETSENKNAPQNRNIATSKVGTDIISFIDSDDVSAPFRNEYLIESFKNTDIKVAVHNFVIFSRTTGIIDRVIEKSPLDLEINCLTTLRSDNPFPINGKSGLTRRMACGHVTMRKEIFDKFKYNEGMDRTQDVEIVQRIVSSGVPLSYIGNELSYYRND